MTLEEFKQLTETAVDPPADLDPTLQALWCDRRGNWQRAHQIAQGIESSAGAWIHAYLHRKEGDPGNARYWYRRAARSESHDPLEQEWDEIAAALLDSGA